MTEVVTSPRAPSAPRSSDLVADSLREAIRTNQLRPGRPLSQVALARQYGVSRIPVREALRQLHAEGLVVWEPGQSAVVADLNRTLLLEVLEVRTLLENYVVDRAMARLDHAAVAELADLCAEMERTPDLTAWGQLNERFHDRVYQAGDSLVAVELVQRLGARADRYLGVPVDPDPERRRRAEEEHRHIVDAMRSGDREVATALMRSHLAHRLARIGELLGDRSDSESVP